MKIDGNEEVLINALRLVDIRTPVAKTLIFFLKNNGDGATAVEIERATKLRQPEVSISTTKLQRLEWLASTKRMSGYKGRPIFVYTLTAKPEDVIKWLGDSLKERVDALQKVHDAIAAIGNK